LSCIISTLEGCTAI